MGKVEESEASEEDKHHDRSFFKQEF